MTRILALLAVLALSACMQAPCPDPDGGIGGTGGCGAKVERAR
ncbi:MAG: hypothetical protein AAF092_04545 [Pseudomonadota bacterium]